MDVHVSLVAGQGREYFERSDFFRLMDAQLTGKISIIFYRANQEVGRAVGVSEGYAEKFLAGYFDKVRIESSDSQDVHFVTREGSEVAYDKAPQGDVRLTGVAGDFDSSNAAVTDAVAASLAAVNASRRYLLVQNNSLSGYLRIRFDGVAPTAASGLRIAPGGYWESNALFVPSGEVLAISESGNIDVELLEG